MNKNLPTAITAIFIAGLLATSLGYAQDKGKCHETMLEFTAEQEPQIADLKMKLIRETAPIKTELKIKQLELRALWKEDNPDTKKVLAKTKEISALKTSLQEKMINHKLAILKILTPEQKKMMQEKMGMCDMGYCGMGDCGMGGCGRPGADKDAGSVCHGAGR
jgi:Spy/CpxP family protein refolding chaperone